MDKNYLSIEEAFQLLLGKPEYNYENLVKPIVESMNKYNFRIIQEIPIKNKSHITYQCNDCGRIGISSYYNLTKDKRNCGHCKPHQNRKAHLKLIQTHEDLLAHPRYGDALEHSRFILLPSDTPRQSGKNLFIFECKKCKHQVGPVFLRWINDIIAQHPEFQGCAECKKRTTPNKSDICDHNKQRRSCIICDGSRLCEHKVDKYACTKCNIKIKCEHNNRRLQCGLCGGNNYCQKHKMQKQNCPCVGSNLCAHNKQRTQCYQCDYPNWLRGIIRLRIYKTFNDMSLTKRYTTIDYLGCSIAQLQHVFREYYNIDKLTFNHHIDHIKPVSRFNLSDEKELHKAFHWTNLQPLLAKENLQKHNKWTDKDEELWCIMIARKLNMFKDIITMDYKNVETMICNLSITRIITTKIDNYVDVSDQELIDNIQKYSALHNALYINEDNLFYIFKCLKTNHEIKLRQKEYTKYIRQSAIYLCHICDKCNIIENNSNCTYIGFEKNNHQFRCNNCQSIRTIQRLDHAVKHNSQCLHCFQQVNRKTSSGINIIKECNHPSKSSNSEMNYLPTDIQEKCKYFEQHNNCTFLKKFGQELWFECNTCHITRSFTNTATFIALHKAKSYCNTCMSIARRNREDQVKQIVEENGFKYMMEPGEYTSNKHVKIMCKHNVVMTKSLADIKLGKGCPNLCKSEKRAQNKPN